jgi:hypothetical protein
MKYQLTGWKSKNIPAEDEMPLGPSFWRYFSTPVMSYTGT